ncbi:GH14724 [Drosophila grimshawi]|uniref:GH14724 n=1 Tax=Drosophila grimshawi TaxID=7222 RepID=B4JUZ2_DROGR|nr:GH14724 [Drosophila grimshawi]
MSTTITSRSSSSGRRRSSSSGSSSSSSISNNGSIKELIAQLLLLISITSSLPALCPMPHIVAISRVGKQPIDVQSSCLLLLCGTRANEP